MRKLILYLFAFCLGITTMSAQTITGVVTGADDGQPLPGVNINVKGTSTGTITNIDGAYSIDVSGENIVLLFSYIGYTTQEIEVGSQTTINVVMKVDSKGLSEVVVIGYGTRVKEELTGSVSTVSAEQLNTTAETSVVNRLQGQISGVTVERSNRPGGEATVKIRGLGTINNSGPLYVIDGVPVGPGNNIPPGDIESISVLKDASSAAIYGTRGANGVIIITTKSGKRNQKPEITFSANYGISKATTKYDLLNTSEYAEAVWLSYANNGVAPNHTQYGTGTTPVIPDYILPGGAMAGDVDESTYSYYDNQIFRANKEGTDWYDEIFQSAVTQEYDISIRGGGEKATYAFSGNYLDEEGLVKFTKFKRYSVRLHADSRLTDWFKISSSNQVVFIDEYGRFTDNEEDSPISDAYRMQPIVPVYDIAGNFAGSKAPEMGNAENPVARITRTKNNNGKYTRILGNFFGEIKPLEGLTIKSLFGYNWGQWNAKRYIIPNPEHSEPNFVNGLDVESNYTFQWNWTNTINYQKTFADMHNLNVIAGTEAIENKFNSLNAGRRNFFVQDPDYMFLDAGETNKENSGTSYEWSLFSIFGRLNYNFMSKYFIEATVRRDGSSRFSEDNRFGVFPAVSAAWAISQESFMSGTGSWLDLLKVRLGWGKAGNDQIGNYNSYSTLAADAYRSFYAIDGSNTTASAGFIPSQIGNEDVTWETTTTYNLGIDAGFLNNSLSLSVDIWKRNTEDMLFEQQIPQISGTATPPDINIGDMENTGFDIEIGYNNTMLDGDLTYNVRLNISHYKNEVVKINDVEDLIIYAGSERQKDYTAFTRGHAFPEFYGYIVDGIFQTQAEADAHATYGTYNVPGHFKYRDLNGDGEITPDDRTFIGSPHPDFTGGLSINLGYKNFGLDMFFYGSYGNELVNYVTRWIDYGMFNGNLSHDALYNSWGSPYLSNNADATLPMLDQNSISQEPSTAFVEDASFLRMKNLRLSYTLPRNILDKVKFKNVRIYAQVSNLFTITKYTGLDPEVRRNDPTDNRAGRDVGLDRGTWPTTRQFMFGLTLGL